MVVWIDFVEGPTTHREDLPGDAEDSWVSSDLSTGRTPASFIWQLKSPHCGSTEQLATCTGTAPLLAEWDNSHPQLHGGSAKGQTDTEPATCLAYLAIWILW